MATVLGSQLNTNSIQSHPASKACSLTFQTTFTSQSVCYCPSVEIIQKRGQCVRDIFNNEMNIWASCITSEWTDIIKCGAGEGRLLSILCFFSKNL